MEICSLVLYHDPVGSCMQVITLRQLLLSPCVHLVTSVNIDLILPRKQKYITLFQ